MVDIFKTIFGIDIPLGSVCVLHAEVSRFLEPSAERVQEAQLQVGDFGEKRGEHSTGHGYRIVPTRTSTIVGSIAVTGKLRKTLCSRNERGSAGEKEQRRERVQNSPGGARPVHDTSLSPQQALEITRGRTLRQPERWMISRGDERENGYRIKGILRERGGGSQGN
jgi:hypothetical protein